MIGLTAPISSHEKNRRRERESKPRTPASLASVVKQATAAARNSAAPPAATPSESVNPKTFGMPCRMTVAATKPAGIPHAMQTQKSDQNDDR